MFARRMCTIWSKGLSQPLKCSSLTPYEALVQQAVDSMRRKPWVRNYSRERKGLYSGNVQQNPLCAASCFTKDIPSLPGSRLRFFIAGQIQHRTVHRFLYTPAQVDAPMYSSRLYAKKTVFEIVHEESVKVYHLHMYNGNIQQNSLCVESCVTEEFNISPRFSPHLRLPATVAKLAVFLSLFEELRNTHRRRNRTYAVLKERNP